MAIAGTNIPLNSTEGEDKITTADKVTSTAKPTKKVITSTAKKVSSKLKPILETNQKIKTKTPGFGLKFTRGLGAFSIFSTITGVLRAKKEAKQTLKKFGIKREPSVMDTLQHTMPKWARPKYYKSLATDV